MAKRLRPRYSLRNSIGFVLVVVTISCLLVVFVSVVRLPEVSREDKRMGLYRVLKMRKVAIEDVTLRGLGELMVGMLPDDLAFTVFVPSEKAFGRDLRMWANDTSMGLAEKNNTFATISRILGFSAVPQKLHSVELPVGKEITVDSISGFKLYVLREFDGTVVVNRVRSERVDLKRGEIVLHIMDGVIMDADFEQSVQPDDEDED